MTAADGNFVALPYYKSKSYATHKTCASSAQEYSANLTRMTTFNQLLNCIFAIFVPASFTQNMVKPWPFEQNVITLHTGFSFFFLFCSSFWGKFCRLYTLLNLHRVEHRKVNCRIRDYHGYRYPNYPKLYCSRPSFQLETKGEKGRQAMSTSQRCERENQSTV